MTHHKKHELSSRIARIEGHVKAIRKMIEEDKTYPEIVQQVSAVPSFIRQSYTSHSK